MGQMSLQTKGIITQKKNLMNILGMDHRTMVPGLIQEIPRKTQILNKTQVVLN